ncbi:MAG: glycosyltransferase family 4 protein [Verrucomicrobia bacterium]|nr:glycosyltransferase family 4 protein [Verrucomicrobiota bacterium]
MKIALLTTDSREHDRDYARTEPGFGTAPEALLLGFREIREVEVHVISCLQKPVCSAGKIADNVYYHGLFVPKLGWLRTGYQGCIRAVRRKLKEIRPDIVHAQGTERDCAISAVFGGYPNAVTLHGNMRLIANLHRAKPWSYLRLAALLEHLALRRTGGVICITAYTKRNVQKLNSRTWIVPNAVDPCFFSMSNKPSEPPTILCVGLVCSRKNQNALIEALVPLREKREFSLLFLGKAPPDTVYTERFLRLVAKHSWIRHAGFTGRVELREELAKATVLVLPSLEDNCPMVILEAAAAGVPVVAAGVGGVPDLVEHNVTGLLCNPYKDTEVRDCVQLVLENPEHAQKMAIQAKQRAIERFHPLAVAGQHIKIYTEILGRRTRVTANA